MNRPLSLQLDDEIGHLVVRLAVVQEPNRETQTDVFHERIDHRVFESCPTIGAAVAGRYRTLPDTIR